MQMTGPMLYNKHDVKLPTRSITMIETKAHLTKEEEGHTYDIKPNFLFMDQNLQLEIIPMIHLLEVKEQQFILFVIINIAHKTIRIPKNEILGYLHNIDDDIKDISLEAIEEDPTLEESSISGPLDHNITLEELDEETLIEKRFITSPADVMTHCKVELKDAEIPQAIKVKFERLCETYKDFFSKDSTDIGKTPLLKMEIDTGDSPPVCQRSYNLPLKHREWV